MRVTLCVGSIRIMDKLRSILPLVLDKASQKVFSLLYDNVYVGVAAVNEV